MVSARSLILSFRAISSVIAAIIVLFVASLTSVAFAEERRGLGVAVDDRGYVGGPLAYANLGDEQLGWGYYARRRQTTLDAAAVSAVLTPKVVVVNGQQIEIVSADELNTIDLTADTPSLELAGVRSPPIGTRATTTLLAQALPLIAGALAGLSVGLFLIRWSSRLALHKSLASL
jgi:hypothetical protein